MFSPVQLSTASLQMQMKEENYDLVDIMLKLKRRKEIGLENNHIFAMGCYRYDLDFCRCMYENDLMDEPSNSVYRDFLVCAISGYSSKSNRGEPPSMELIKYLVETCGFKLQKDEKELWIDKYDSLFYPRYCIEPLKYFVGIGHTFRYKINNYIVNYYVEILLYDELQKEKVKLLVFLNGKLPYRYVQMEILLAIKWAHVFTPADVFSLLS